MNQQRAQESPPGELLSVPAVAQRLAVNRYFVYELIREGHLPALRLGRRNGIRVRRDDLERWLAEQAV